MSVNVAQSSKPRGAWSLCMASLLALGTSSCGLFRNSVNASPELRWFLFSNFGAQRMCPEMLKRGAPLKLTPNGNAIGRFFPERCTTQVNDAAIAAAASTPAAPRSEVRPGMSSRWK